MSKDDKQLLELWRTIRGNAKAFSGIVAKMDKAEVRRVLELWQALRWGQARSTSGAKRSGQS